MAHTDSNIVKFGKHIEKCCFPSCECEATAQIKLVDVDRGRSAGSKFYCATHLPEKQKNK